MRPIPTARAFGPCRAGLSMPRWLSRTADGALWHCVGQCTRKRYKVQLNRPDPDADKPAGSVHFGNRDFQCAVGLNQALCSIFKLQAKAVLRGEFLNDGAIAVVMNRGGVSNEIVNVERRWMRRSFGYGVFACPAGQCFRISFRHRKGYAGIDFVRGEPDVERRAVVPGVTGYVVGALSRTATVSRGDLYGATIWVRAARQSG